MLQLEQPVGPGLHPPHAADPLAATKRPEDLKEKAESFRVAFVELHSGHATVSLEEKTSSSKSDPQSSQEYSYIGMTDLEGQRSM